MKTIHAIFGEAWRTDQALVLLAIIETPVDRRSARLPGPFRLRNPSILQARSHFLAELNLFSDTRTNCVRNSVYS